MGGFSIAPDNLLYVILGLRIRWDSAILFNGPFTGIVAGEG